MFQFFDSRSSSFEIDGKIIHHMKATDNQKVGLEVKGFVIKSVQRGQKRILVVIMDDKSVGARTHIFVAPILSQRILE